MAVTLRRIYKAFHLSGKIIFRGLAFILFGIFLIALLASFTNFAQVLELMINFPLRFNFFILFFLALYFLIKFQLFRFLISSLNLSVSFSRMGLVFVVGELAREFPIGPGFFLLLLVKPAGQALFPFKLFAVPIVQIAIEMVVAFSILVIFGVGDHNYVRILALEGIFLAIVVGLLVKKFGVPKLMLKIAKKSGFLPKTAVAGIEIKKGLEVLISGKTISFGYLLVIFYMLALSMVLFSIGRVVAQDFVPSSALSTFAVSYIFAILSPMPIDLGVTESSGFLVLTTIGSSREAALAMMLIYRLILTFFSWLMVVLVLIVLFSEVKKILYHFLEKSDFS